MFWPTCLLTHHKAAPENGANQCILMHRSSAVREKCKGNKNNAHYRQAETKSLKARSLGMQTSIGESLSRGWPKGPSETAPASDADPPKGEEPSCMGRGHRKETGVS